MQKLTHENYCALCPEAKLEYRYELAFYDLERRRRTGKPLAHPTVSGLFKSTKQIPKIRVEQWEVIERLCFADVRDCFAGATA